MSIENGGDNVTHLRTEQQKADDIRAAMRPLLEQIAAIMTAANRDGLKVGFAINSDSFGRFLAPNVEITKAL